MQSDNVVFSLENDTEEAPIAMRKIQLIGKAMVPERDQRMQMSPPRYANEVANFITAAS